MDNGNTYTYIARNYDNPDQVITFTLVDHHLRVGLSEMVEKAAKVVAADEKGEELKGQLKSQLGPIRLKAMEQFSGPYHVDDIRADLEDEHLKLKGWNRVLGMRLSPYAVDLGRVDNPDAAEAFVQQLEERKESAPDAGRFVGPLDYWFSWLAILAAVALLIRWPRKK